MKGFFSSAKAANKRILIDEYLHIRPTGFYCTSICHLLDSFERFSKNADIFSRHLDAVLFHCIVRIEVGRLKYLTLFGVAVNICHQRHKIRHLTPIAALFRFDHP